MEEGSESKLHLGYCMSTDPYTTALAFEGWVARKKQAGFVCMSHLLLPGSLKRAQH